MNKHMPLRFLIVLGLGFSLLIGCSDTPTTNPPSEAQVNAFKAAKSFSVKVSQSYSGGISAKLPFELIAASVLPYSGMKQGGGGVTLVVKAQGSTQDQRSIIKGTITFKLPGAPSYTRTFEGITAKPHLSKYYSRVGKTYYDSEVINQPGSFTSKLFEIIAMGYGTAPAEAALKDKNKEVRRNAAVALGELKKAEAVPSLIAAFRDDDPSVKGDVVEALAKIGQPAVPPLQEAARDKDMVVRRHATAALAKIADPTSIAPWIDMLRDEDPKVQETATATLVKAGPAAVAPLLAALNDKDKYFRKNVIVALGELKDPKAVPALVDQLSDKEPRNQMAAINALINIGAPAIDPLINALKDKNVNVRVAAAGALGDIKDPRVVDPLISALKDKDKMVRSIAAMSLGKTGDKKAVAPLTEAMNQKNSDIKDAAGSALAMLNKGGQ